MRGAANRVRPATAGEISLAWPELLPEGMIVSVPLDFRSRPSGASRREAATGVGGSGGNDFPRAGSGAATPGGGGQGRGASMMRICFSAGDLSRNWDWSWARPLGVEMVSWWAPELGVAWRKETEPSGFGRMRATW